MMNSLAVVVTLTRKTDTITAYNSLVNQSAYVRELVIIDDGSGEGTSPLIAKLRAVYPAARLVTFKSPSFFIGSWRPVVDTLVSTHVYFLPPGIVVGGDYFRRVLEHAEAQPECGVIYGDAINHGESWLQRASEEQSEQQNTKAKFAQALDRWTSLQRRHYQTAVYKTSSWLAAGGFRAELDSCNYLLPFIITGLNGDSCFIGPSGCVCLQEDLLFSSYVATSPFRCLDDLARVHYFVKNEVKSDVTEKITDEWYNNARTEYIEFHVAAINRHVISGNKTVDVYKTRFSLLAVIFARMLQVMLGLCRRVLSGFVRRAAVRYKPDVDCFGWIKPSFSFGINWKNFLKSKFDDDRLAIAKKELLDFLGVSNLQSQTFVDIGCGSGIHSLAALQAGVSSLYSFDYDIESVNATKRLHEREGRPVHWTVTHGSILDDTFVASVPRADIVYSWGVLHHTGQMWPAIKSASTMVKDGGLFFIAIYTKWTGSDDALRLKIKYNKSSWLGKRYMELCLMRDGVPGISYMVKDFRHFRERIAAKINLIRNYRQYRGMSFYYDIVDWLGGYPYEDATVEEIVWFCEKHCGLKVVKVQAEGGNICSSYLFRKTSEA